MTKSHTRIRLGLICLLAALVFATNSLMPALASSVSQAASETRVITIPAPEGAASFGESIAYDGKTLVVGAPRTNVDGVEQQGMAYIYELDPANPAQWKLQATATFTQPISYSGLGSAVAVENDLIAIGAPMVDAPLAVQNGALLVVERHPNDGTWQVTHFERNMGDEEGDPFSMGNFANFGAAVEVYNKVIFVGAPGSDVREPSTGVIFDNYGAVYGYARIAGQFGRWSEFGIFWDDDGGRNDMFGSSIALDTYQDVGGMIIGAPDADVAEPFDNMGEAIIYRRPPGADVLSPYMRLHRSEEDAHGQFGGAVALDDFVIVAGGYAIDHEGKNMVGEVVISLEGVASSIVHASDATEYAYFGLAVDVDQGIVAIGAPGAPHYDFGDWGAVYRFEVRDNAWVEVANYGDEDGVDGGSLGTSVKVYDGLVMAGAPGADGGRGAVYIFDDRPVEEPEKPVAETGKVPTNIEPVAGAPDDDDPDDDDPDPFAYQLFMPATAHETADMEPPDDDPPGDILPTLQLLQNNNSIQSNYGAILGALENTLAEAIDSYIVAVSPPITVPHESLKTVGHYYAMGTITTSIVTTPSAPFVVALPVPDGVDASQLAAALYMNVDNADDSEPADEWEWLTVVGAYDAEAKLFSFTLNELSIKPLLAVLVAHPNHIQIEPDATLASGQNAGAIATQFRVQCSSRLTVDHPLCSVEVRSDVAEALLTAYQDFTALGFKEPALLSRRPYYKPGDPQPKIEQTQTYYGITISAASCDLLGLYEEISSNLSICVDAQVGVDEKVIDVIRHELFHAIQYSYAGLRTDWNVTDVGWVIEGTAAAAERSLATMAHAPRLNTRAIDVELNHPHIKGTFFAYQAQDFWVYWGQVLGQPLSYLISIFTAGGEAADVDAARGNTLENSYWRWVKNQVFEKEHGPHNRFEFSPCELEFSLVDETLIQVPNPSPTRSAVLSPLSATVYVVTFAEQINQVNVQVLRGGPDTTFKIYQDGKAGCAAAPDAENMTLDANPGDVLYVVVANTGYDNPEPHKLVISAGGE